ncbi:hypothetical protein ACQPXB_35935 [Amycolatopsis sp. CA-161197]|uniref:VG15 protein n=1 Tax=Amycolatopsis sp. CA-161197 TaxID=3239922 RepID=UPI003D91C29C
MALPSSARDIVQREADAQTALTQEALAQLEAASRAGATNPERWRDAIADAAEALLSLQVQMVEGADDYVTALLEEQGAPILDAPALNLDGFADMTAGGGSWLKNLIYAPISVGRQARELGVDEARRHADLVAMSIVASGMQDAGRAAVTAMGTGRGATRYVRMLNGKSCARCAILAGRVYRVSAFPRHDRCDCKNVPTVEDTADDWRTDPKQYFRSLSTEDQDQVFGEAGAQAIRDGADMSQVVNAYDGVTVATAFGREVRATTTGTTRRALFGGYEIRADGTLRKRTDAELQKVKGSRYRRAKAPRLLPDEIYSLAEEFDWNRDEILRQLRRFAYLL